MTNSLILAIYIVMGIYIGVEAYKGSSLEEKSNRFLIPVLALLALNWAILTIGMKSYMILKDKSNEKA